MYKNCLDVENFTRLVNFRQQVRNCFSKRGDALFSLLDAVKQTPSLNSFVELSLAPAFHHRWHSAYAALSASQVEVEKLHRLCLEQVPKRKALFFALDVMNVRRPKSKTLAARQVCHGAKREAFGNGVIIGLPYSCLAFSENAASSWAPTVNTQRILPEEKAVAVAIEQIKWLSANLDPQIKASVGLDGSYGNVGFYLGLRGIKAFVVARMRNDRTLYRRPREPDGKPGRDPKYGERFKFDEPATWDEAEEVVEFEDEKHGQVRIEKWSQLRFRVAREVVEIEVVRSQIHLERENPSKPRWYGIHNETGEKTDLRRSYLTAKHRWSIEPANRFKKERLYAEQPKVRQAASSDQWLQMSQVLDWETYLWRPMAKDARLPWQAELSVEKLTPGRVLRSLALNLSKVGTPVGEVLPRGKSAGWEKGRKRTRPQKHKLRLKGQKKPVKQEKRE